MSGMVRMRAKGHITGFWLAFDNKKPYITLELDARPEDIEKYREKELTVELKQFRKQRSADANALLWACLGEIGRALNRDTWSIYLDMLKQYGQFTYMSIPKGSLELMKRQWRELMVVDEDENTYKVLAFFGSSSYNSKEFSLLLDGVIEEMKELGLEPPTSQEMQQALERLK